MKRLLLAFVLVSGCCLGGCNGYFADRWADARDILTVTGSAAVLGVRARVGTVHVGSYNRWFEAGLHGGELDFASDFMASDDDDTDYTVWSSLKWPGNEKRGKCYNALGFAGVSWVHSRTGWDRPWYYLDPYYTQVEVAAGFLVGARLGVNVGEIFDFLLGWTTLDICGDDISTMPEETAGPTPQSK